MSFDEVMDYIRTEIKKIAKVVNDNKGYMASTEFGEGIDKGEILANITLSYRHLEDASMRIGKVKQHLNGGVSVYDENVVGSPEK